MKKICRRMSVRLCTKASLRRPASVSRTSVSLVVALACVLLLPGSAVGAMPRYQPDGMIKRAGDRQFLGQDIWNTTAAGQTRSVSVLAGATVTFMLRFQNEGRNPDTFVIHGCSSGGGITVHYFHHGQEITGPVTSGHYKTRMLASGDLSGLTMKITTGTNFGGTNPCQVVSTSKASPGREDVVEAQVYTQA